MASIVLQEIDRVEILTLQDNYIDITATDNGEIISRARNLLRGTVGKSVRAEHGFSAIVKTTRDGKTKTMLFDFGISEDGAAHNARVLDVDMREIEVMALSHGHYDHFGGLESLVKMIGKKEIKLVVHPYVFKYPRYIKISDDLKADIPEFTRERVEKAGVKLVETKRPYSLLDGNVLFLGEIERKTTFEKGMPNAYFMENGIEKWDPIEDDTSIVMNLRGKGLVVLSGCAHSGIVNSVNYAKSITEIDKVHVVMGGFHLGGPLFEPIIGQTVEELKKINPVYVIPCHCTGRKASVHIENHMPDQFILNMSGTRLTFDA
ncbi:MAG: MBL fold metallo-hydrolase [Syntrophobacterales bacterium]|nr:MBL fold metallo-hydrolase [Syntrophobacterales bacterium]